MIFGALRERGLMPSETEKEFFVHCGWLIDGTGAIPVRDRVLIIGGGTIRSIRHWMGEHEPEETLDFSNHTVIPALVDTHVHLAWSETVDPEARKNQFFADYESACFKMAENVRKNLYQGVAAVRDGGDHFGHALRFARQEGEAGLVLCCAGRAWHAPGRYGRIIGREVPAGETLAQALARENEPAHHVKVVQSGLNSLTEYGKKTPPQFSLEELSHAVGEARKRGLGIMAHANGREPVRIAVQAGVASVEHGFFLGRENLKLMADRQVTWVPTAVTMAGLCRALPKGREHETARRMLDDHLQALAWAREHGVPVASGTDAGGVDLAHGDSLLEEIVLFMEAGYPPDAAVSAATRQGAKLLDLESLGSLTPGKDASFLVLPGPPESLAKSLENPACVYIKGEKTERD